MTFYLYNDDSLGCLAFHHQTPDMARTLDAVIKGLPFDQQQEIEDQAARLIEEEMSLRHLRKAYTPIQKRMTEALHITQDGVPLTSNPSFYADAMGGK